MTDVPAAESLRADTETALARGRQMLAAWDKKPGLAIARVTAQALADMLNTEFPGQHPGRVLASAMSGIACAGAVMAEHTGSEPDSVVLVALATAVAALAEEEGAGRD